MENCGRDEVLDAKAAALRVQHLRQLFRTGVGANASSSMDNPARRPAGPYFQQAQYVNTSDFVRQISNQATHFVTPSSLSIARSDVFGSDLGSGPGDWSHSPYKAQVLNAIATGAAPNQHHASDYSLSSTLSSEGFSGAFNVGKHGLTNTSLDQEASVGASSRSGDHVMATAQEQFLQLQAHEQQHRRQRHPQVMGWHVGQPQPLQDRLVLQQAPTLQAGGYEYEYDSTQILWDAVQPPADAAGHPSATNVRSAAHMLYGYDVRNSASRRIRPASQSAQRLRAAAGQLGWRARRSQTQLQQPSTATISHGFRSQIEPPYTGDPDSMRGPAAATAAAIAAAAANSTKLLALASSHFHTNSTSAAAPAASTRRRTPTSAPTRAKPLYAPENGDAFLSRLPVFLNTTNLQQSGGRQVRRGPTSDAASTSTSAFTKGVRAQSKAAGTQAAGPQITVPAPASESYELQRSTVADSDEVRAARHTARSAAFGHTTGQKRHACRPVSPEPRRAGAAGRFADRNSDGNVLSGAGGGGAADGPLASARYVYPLQSEVDVHHPDMAVTRPRAPSAVMARSRRGLEPVTAGADNRPALEVSDTLMRKRVPSASFASASFRPQRPREGDHRPGERGYAHAASRSSEGAVERMQLRGGGMTLGGGGDEERGRGGRRKDISPVWARRSSSPAAASSQANADPSDWGRTASAKLTPRDNTRSARSRSRSRGRSARSSGRWSLKLDQSDGEGGSSISPAPQRLQVTAEPLVSAPSVHFSRAARFPRVRVEGVQNEDEDLAGWEGSSRLRRCRTGGDDAGNTTVVVKGEGVDKSQTALQLDAAYRAILPRTSAAFISANSRRIDWLSPDPGTRTKQRPQQRSLSPMSARSRSTSRPPKQLEAVREPVSPLPAGGSITDADESGGAVRSASAEQAPSLQDAALAPTRRRSQSAPSQRESGRARSKQQHRQRSSSVVSNALRGSTSHTQRPIAEAGGMAGEGSDRAADGTHPVQPHASSGAVSGSDDDSSDGGEVKKVEKAEGEVLWGRGRSRRWRRRSGEDPPLEPLAPLEHLEGAVQAVRPRVQVARFGYRSVAESMRQELKVRQVRQLEKARQLREWLRNQPMEMLWPAVAAQLRRGRPRSPGATTDQPLAPPAMSQHTTPRDLLLPGGEATTRSSPSRHQGMPEAQETLEAVRGSLSDQRPATTGAVLSDAPDHAPTSAGSSPGHSGLQRSLLDQTDNGEGGGQATTEQSQPSTAHFADSSLQTEPPSRGVRGTGSPIPGTTQPIPEVRPPSTAVASTAAPEDGGTLDGLVAVTVQHEPHHVRAVGAAGAGVAALSASTAGPAATQRPQPAAVTTPPRSQRSSAISPERPPHFLAPTAAMLASPGSGAATDSGRPGNAAGVPRVRLSSANPSFALVEKRAPATLFSPARAAPPRPRYSREPGPGHYDPHLADAALSRITRAPTPLFGTSRRADASYGSDGPESPVRHRQGSGAAAAAEVAWLIRDPGAALDYTRRRAPAVVISPAPPTTEGASGDERASYSEEGTLVLDVRFTLVEPRIRGAPLMRKPQPSVVVTDEVGQPLERLSEMADPWSIDQAIRTRRPAWGFPALGHQGLEQSLVSRGLLDLRPVYHLVERRVQGVQDFARAADRQAGEEERARRLRRQPDGGDYDAAMAWAYLCRRAPQVIMRLAAPRGRQHKDAEGDSRGLSDGSGEGDGDGGDQAVRQHRQALVELSQALDYIRPRPPAWSFAPIVRVVRRDLGGMDSPGDLLRAAGRGYGPLLSWDVDITLVRRRLPGALPFGAGPPRQGLLDPRALAALRHLAPGYYEVDAAWRAAQPAPRAPHFARGAGHDLGIVDLRPPDDGGDLPYGTRLVLDAAAAKDATLQRRSRGPLQALALALGRAEALPVDSAYQAPTAHLPLPDPELDRVVRPRLRNVVLEGGPGHQPPAPEPSIHEALRGPGAYYPAGAEQALATVGPAAPAVDFGRRTARAVLEDGRVDGKEALEGNRLVLSPQTALDYVRPRPPAAVIPPVHANTDSTAPYDLPYHHALYDIVPGLEMKLRRPAGQPGFDAMPGRDPPLAWPGGIDPLPAPYGQAVDWLAPEDVALSRLAGYRRAPGGPDFATMRPRTATDKVDYDGQRLALDPVAALDRLRHQPPRAPNLALGQGHGDPTLADGRDPDLTAWLDYQPRLDAVRRRLVAPLAVQLDRQLAREQAIKADPRVGDNATGDLDGGVYRVQHRLVMRSVPAIDFGRAASITRWGMAPGTLPSDPEEGNVLMLEPQQARGWRPALHADNPDWQPFGRGEGRWEQPGADPAYRFLAAVGDEGGALYLRHSADNLGALRRRPTVANAPGAPWGWMTAHRDAQVLLPDPARRPLRRHNPAPFTPGIRTQLVVELPPRNAEIEVLKNKAPHDPQVVAIRRRDRVLQRMLDKIKAQRAALVDI